MKTAQYKFAIGFATHYLHSVCNDDYNYELMMMVMMMMMMTRKIANVTAFGP